MTYKITIKLWGRPVTLHVPARSRQRAERKALLKYPNGKVISCLENNHGKQTKVARV